MNIDEKYIRRSIELAARGRGNTKSNPMVGAVIVHKGKIIGEGYHRKHGEGHAEVNAIRSVKDESLLAESTIYVSLEPCSHHGKTPPCADLIIEKDIPRVVVACLDPFSEVSGRGIKKLKDAGVEVITGVLEKEAWELNNTFMTAHTLQRPYVILKWAQSIDGFIDKVRTDACTAPIVFSTPYTNMLVHKLRSEVSAIMVGTNTAILDNPSLNVRTWSGDSPIRVVVDRNLRIPKSTKLYDGSSPTLFFTEKEETSEYNNVEYIKVNFSENLLHEILKNLYSRNLTSLLVEGGATLHNHFIKEGLWDEIRIETGNLSLGEGVPAPDITTALNQTDNYSETWDYSFRVLRRACASEFI